MKQLSSQTKYASASSGIWYAVPADKLFSVWEIAFQRADEHEKELYHTDLWQDYIVPDLEQIFKLDKANASKLLTCDSGIPRGRVQSPKESGGYEIGWVIYYGGDCPEIIRHQVVRGFGLDEIRRANKLKWEVSEDEKMNEREKEIVLEILRS